ncbi:MAG: hypothetical protein AABX98_00920, partial [Nanoarchaeota archaeon]
DKVAQRYTQYGNRHPFNAINADESQGGVLFVGSDDSSGLKGDNLYYLGRFLVGVAPEALVGAERRAPQTRQELPAEKGIIAPTLEEVLAIGTPFVTPIALDQFRVEMQKLYKQ